VALSLRLRRAGIFISGYFAGSFSTEGGTVPKTAYIAEGVYTNEMTDMYGYGICCQYGAGKFKITVKSESVAISSSRYFRDVVRESIFVVMRGTGFAADYRLDVVYDDV
jgi:hypothetical protein